MTTAPAAPALAEVPDPPLDDPEALHAWVLARAEEMKALGETAPRAGRDPVNQPQVHTWLEAMGDRNPVYRDTPEAHALHGGPVAPTAMAQVWTMFGLDPARPALDPLHGTMRLLDRAGYTSVLGTNCDQTYARPLRPGEEVAITTRLESVVGPKTTGVGTGYFVTTVNTWWVGDEPVATMTFRVLKFAPRARPAGPDRSRILRPVRNRDTDAFWEATADGRVLLQRCEDCGVLRHPPGPFCPACRSTTRGWVEASGRGTVHSWTVHHAPQIPGRPLPLPLVLVELEEGVRMVGVLDGVDAAELAEPSFGEGLVGQPVHAVLDRVGDDLTLVAWRRGEAPAEEPAPAAAPAGTPPPVQEAGPGDLPAWELPITTTLVVSTALATRDFQDVHHDRDLAVQRGSKDVFLNILTTTGLVQRYVTDHLGHRTRITACALRLGAPAYPGDALRFTGTVRDAVRRPGPTGPEVHAVVDVVGAVSLGAHVTAQVSVVLPEGVLDDALVADEEGQA